MNEINQIDIIDAIIFSKEFRRLEDKTQLFSVSRGNHYRNRLTHTMEVLAIAKKIAKELNEIILHDEYYKTQHIDEELVESIALAHDLGHTPFGHIGERTLQNILSRKDSLGGIISNISAKEIATFKHNINSGKILLTNFNGIDYRVVDGAIKHTYIFYKNFSDNGLLRIISKSEFEKEIKKVIDNIQYWKILYPITIEGQIVSIADEIAQRCADLDDTYRSRYLNKVKNLIDYDNLDISITKPDHNQYDIIISEIKFVLIEGIKSSFKVILKNHKELCFNKLININIVNYNGEIDFFDFNLTMNMNNGAFQKYKKEKEEKRKKYIEEIINDKNKEQLTNYEKANKLDYNLVKITEVVLNNYDIRLSDSKSKQIIRQLFKAFFNNYKQLGNKEIICMCQDIKDYLCNKHFLKLKNMDSEIEEYNRNNENKIHIDKLYMKQENNEFFLVDFFKSVKQFKIYSESKDEWLDFYNIDNLIDFIKDNHYKCDQINHLYNIFLIHIANYIANMTDSFAYKKYRELYGIEK